MSASSSTITSQMSSSIPTSALNRKAMKRLGLNGLKTEQKILKIKNGPTIIFHPIHDENQDLYDTLPKGKQEAINKILKEILSMSNYSKNDASVLTKCFSNSLKAVGRDLDPDFLENAALKEMAVQICELSRQLTPLNEQIAALDETIKKIDDFLSNKTDSNLAPLLKQQFTEKSSAKKVEKDSIKKKITNIEEQLTKIEERLISKLSIICSSCHKTLYDLRKTDSAVKMHLCGRCRKARYCSQTCQKDDWKDHQKKCKEKKASAKAEGKETKE